MNGDIEELVLSGKLFNPPSRSSSPTRSRSPSPSPVQWPIDDTGYDYDSDAERRRALEARIASQQQNDSIGMGPGRTGVKGVIRDRAEAASLARSKRVEEINALNKAMEKANLGGKTWAEEEEERLAEKAREEGWVPTSVDKAGRRGRFGYLREVGVRSFVQAVEEEDRRVWVVVHIYDPSLDRCAELDETLSRLARIYPSTKFLRARAGKIGFASSAGQTTSRQYSQFPLTQMTSRKIVVPGRYSSDCNDDDDPYGEGDNEDDDEHGVEVDEHWEDDAVDTDVLPTLLVYRGGELVHSWVRVDWEAKLGIEDLLRRHNILAGSLSGDPKSKGGFPSDDEEFDDSELVFGGNDDGY